MTENEAIKKLKTDIQNCYNGCKGICRDVDKNGLCTCIQTVCLNALEEVQRYRAIGTVEKCENTVHELIAGKFKRATEEWNDETDFYMDLLEIGIDVNLVRKHMGDETAEHMESYCKDHGLL